MILIFFLNFIRKFSKTNHKSTETSTLLNYNERDPSDYYNDLPNKLPPEHGLNKLTAISDIKNKNKLV